MDRLTLSPRINLGSRADYQWSLTPLLTWGQVLAKELFLYLYLFVVLLSNLGP